MQNKMDNIGEGHSIISVPPDEERAAWQKRQLEETSDDEDKIGK